MSDLMYSHLVRCCAVVSILISFVAAPLAGQTLFQWSLTPIDITRYKTPEQCLSFIERLRDSIVFTSDGIDRDTLPLTLAELRTSPDSLVIHAATRCSEKYAPDRVAPHDLIPVMQLYLMAGRDVDAYTLVTRVLASSAAEGEANRVNVLADIIREYINAQPSRLSAIPPFLDMIAEGPAEVDPRGRMNTLHAFLGAARRNQDTVLIQRAANTLLQLARRVPKALRSKLDDESVFTALEALSVDTLLDSLRQSTSAYVAMHRGLQTQAGATKMIGETAPPLTADYWFVSHGAEGPASRGNPLVRPSPGKVSVIVFLEPWTLPTMLVPNYDVIGPQVRGSLAAVRRLSLRYPDLDVTAVTETHGVFQRMEPLVLDAEADTLRRYWLEFWRLPGTLAIERSPFNRLPAPDLRVIEENPPNIEHYNFGVQHAATRMWTFIVDRDGTIVWYGKVDRETEAEMDRIIGILLRRNAGGV